MLKVTVLAGKPHVNEGKAKATGLPYRIVEQSAQIHLPNGEAPAFTIQPPKDAPPYAPGTYALDPASFYVRDGKLNFSPKLVAVEGTK